MAGDTLAPIAMKRPFAIALRAPVFLCAASLAAFSALPLAAHAQTLEASLTCEESAHEFVSGLIGRGLIEPTPMRVESNSINAFWPAHGEHMTAYGYTVFAIVGFEQDDALFQKGSGKPIARSAYGAVVLGSDRKVGAAVTEAGNHTAIVYHAGPLLTAIFCKQE